MHAPPFSLECIVPDFCFLDAVHLHFSKSSSSMKMCVVSSDSDFDLGFDGMCFATPFWLTGCWISRKWKWSFWLTGTLTYLIFKHLLDIEHPVNQKVHFMAKPMSSKHKTKSDSLFTRWTKTALMIYKDFPERPKLLIGNKIDYDE